MHPGRSGRRQRVAGRRQGGEPRGAGPAGLPVPRAFCVTTHAYRVSSSGTSLSRRASTPCSRESTTTIPPASSARAGDPGADRGVPASRRCRGGDRAGIPCARAELGAACCVSVRSSATAEDLPGMSFAGQQDTYLYISGAPRCSSTAVRRCWASLWTDRAIAYRHHQGFAHEHVASRRGRAGDVPVRGLRGHVHREPGDVEPARALPQLELGAR